MVIFFYSFQLFGLEGNEGEVGNVIDSKIKIPVNKFNTFRFSEEYSTKVRYGLYVFGPLFMVLYGFTTWGWSTRESFTLRPETCRGSHSVDGASDKYGHLYGNYTMKRLATTLFRATGSSRNRANIEGALLTEIITLGGEIGDGFADEYGFDPYDIIFNNIGILIAMLLDYSPVLDNVFTIKWEYVPTKDMREKYSRKHHDIFTDYSGQKVIFATKFVGIPYISLTPLRYVNFDIGYYSRGYNPAKYFQSRTRNLYIGFSVNLTTVFGDLLPVGYISSSLQSLGNYLHFPYDYEVEEYVISDRPHYEFQ